MADNADLNLLRERIKETNSRFARAALLLLVVVTLVGYTTSRATREVERLGLPQKFNDAKTLANASDDSSVQNRVTVASPARQFFFLASLVAEPMRSHLNSSDSNKSRQEVCALLSKYNQSCESDHDDAMTLVERQAAANIAQQLAGEVERGYADAFSVSIGAAGAQVAIDLRNWLALVPPGLILAACYFYLLGHERTLLNGVARRLTTNSWDAPVVDRLSFPASKGMPPLQSSASLLGGLLFLAVLGLQFRVLIVASHALLSSPVEDFLYPAGIYGAILVSYAIEFCVVRSKMMDATVFSETGMRVMPGLVARMFHYITSRWRRLLARMPKRITAASACLILLTLTLPMAMSGCEMVKGYELVTSPMSPSQILGNEYDPFFGKGVWWFPTLGIDVNASPDGTAQDIAKAVLVIDQEAGWALYVAVLAIAVTGLAMLIWARVRRLAPDPTVARILVGIAYFAGYFFTLDLAFLFVGAFLRLPLLVVLVPLALVAFWPVSPESTRSVIQRIGLLVVVPILVVGQIFVIVFSAVMLQGYAVLMLSSFLFGQALLTAVREPG